MKRLCLALLTALVPFGPGAFAQDGDGDLGRLRTGIIQSPVLVIDFDRVYEESAYGLRVIADLEEESAGIAAQNRKIEAELIAEERRLTEQRAQMDPATFQKLAEEFDLRVQGLREEQDSKARALGQRSEEARLHFFSIAQPIIEDLMRSSGAVVLLDKRAVYLAIDAVDLTERAIARLDARIDDGGTTDQ